MLRRVLNNNLRFNQAIGLEILIPSETMHISVKIKRHMLKYLILGDSRVDVYNKKLSM